MIFSRVEVVIVAFICIKFKMLFNLAIFRVYVIHFLFKSLSHITNTCYTENYHASMQFALVITMSFVQKK